MKTELPFLRGKRIRCFEAIQQCLVPMSQEFSMIQKEESCRLVNDLLKTQPEKNRIRLALFLYLIDIVAIITGLRPFRLLSSCDQKKVLNFFFNCPVPLLRKGFWGLNTLAKLGVYGQTSVYPRICYYTKEVENG